MLTNMECARPHTHHELEAVVALLGGKWVIEILHHIRSGSNRFGILRKKMPRISSKTLAERLRLLEKEGLIHKHVLIATAPQHIEYTLTDRGVALGTLMHLFNDWHRLHGHD